MVKSPSQEASIPTLSLVDDLDRLYREQAARMWRALTAYSGDRDLAQDAVAEAFAQAMACGTVIRSPEGWVWKAAYRIAAGELHRRESCAALTAEPPVADDEPAWEIRAALAQLSARQRIAIVLHYYVGYPAREIARITGSTPAAVWMCLSRARRELRRILEEGDD